MGKLRTFLLFLCFLDPWAKKTYAVESESVVKLFIVCLPWASLFFGAVVGWLVMAAYGLFGFLAYFLGLLYLCVQTGHVYDYVRATRR